MAASAIIFDRESDMHMCRPEWFLSWVVFWASSDRRAGADGTPMGGGWCMSRPASIMTETQETCKKCERLSKFFRTRIQ